jgi:hypothetical protein
MKRIFGIVSLIALLAVAYAHWVLPGKVETSMNGVLPHEPYAISDRAKRLHESLFIADLHSDSLLWKRDLLEESDVGLQRKARPVRITIAPSRILIRSRYSPLRHSGRRGHGSAFTSAPCTSWTSCTMLPAKAS